MVIPDKNLDGSTKSIERYFTVLRQYLGLNCNIPDTQEVKN